jgi:opacity protein-like surface antigen
VEVLNDQAGPAGTSYNGSVQVSGGQSDWLATVRGRLGFAFDRLLIYGTGGVAFQDAGRTTTTTTLNRVDCRPDVIAGGSGRVAGVCVTTPTTYGSTTGRRNDVGWAAGIGVEYAALPNVSIGVEYLHADFGDYAVAFVDPVLTAAADRRISAVPVNNTSFATLSNPTTRDPGTAPPPVITRVRINDAVDLLRLKVNVRF